MNTFYNQYCNYLKHLIQVECAEQGKDFDDVWTKVLGTNVIVSVTENQPLNVEDGKDNREKEELRRLEEERLKEQSLWSKCVSIEDFENYLREYPSGRFVVDAKDKVKNMTEQKKEKMLWDSCKTQEDYENYIREFPVGEHIEEAKKIIDELRKINKGPVSHPGRGDIEFEDGYYIGDTKDGKMHGKGTRYWDANDKKWEGEWKDGEASGHVVVSFGDMVIFDGQMEHGLPNGQGTYTDPESGQVYVGKFVDFKREGEGILYTDTNQKIYEGGWKNNKYHGFGWYYMRGQKRYEGNWENGMRNGEGISYTASGEEEYNGLWKDNSRVG